MIQITTVILIMLVHFLADFGLQTHEQATKKGTSNRWLFYHVGVYSSIMWIAALCQWNDPAKGLEFAFITFVSHFVTDWITSRIGKPFWAKEDYHNGFVVVGFDQLLHLIQLLYSYQLINQL